MTQQLDILFANISRDYLDTDASRSAGVPAANACALLSMDADTDDKDPRICLMVDVQGSGRSRQLNVIALARGTQPRAVTAPWLAAVGERLADAASFYAWLKTLPEEKRAGWELHHLTRPLNVKVQHEEGGVIESGIGVAMHVMV
ncbi:MAG: hypothetical protein Q8M07_04980 [Prosthecobacter sp.]|nr:hypothetical protein [Prosthecobacter sp.]